MIVIVTTSQATKEGRVATTTKLRRVELLEPLEPLRRTHNHDISLGIFFGKINLRIIFMECVK